MHLIVWHFFIWYKFNKLWHFHRHLWHKYYTWISFTAIQLYCCPVSVHLYCVVIIAHHAHTLLCPVILLYRGFVHQSLNTCNFRKTPKLKHFYINVNYNTIRTNYFNYIIHCLNGIIYKIQKRGFFDVILWPLL